MEERTEAELVTLAQAGDTDAFAQPVERVQVMASALAFRLIANPEMVREVVQEATLQAFLSLGRLRDPTRFKPWFYGIVLNLRRTWLREQKTRVFSLDAYTAERQATFPRFLETPDPYEIIEEQELQQLIQEAVQRLAPHTRSVIWLFYYQELHMQDIATRLGISLAAVKNRLYKGRSELRRHLLGAYPEMERRHQVAPGKRRRKTMIAVKLIHVVRQPLQHAAVLLDERGQRVLPIWMKGKEGYLVSATFSSHWDMSVVDASGQPRMNFSNQFLWELLEAVRDSVEEVRVDTLQEELLYGTVRLHLNVTSHEIKTTIGMALVVAIRMQCPILVPEALLNARGLSLPAEGATLEQQLTHLVQMLGKHLPTFPVTTQVAGQAKQPHNLDFSEGTQGWQHGEFIPSHSGHSSCNSRVQLIRAPPIRAIPAFPSSKLLRGYRQKAI
jgi:RNA polymerase sigma factor (sigma-70 family)